MSTRWPALDRTGYYGLLRPNWEQGPTAARGVRQAMLAAIDQVEVMTATMGEDKSLYNAPVGIFIPGSSGENAAGMELVRTRKPVGEIKALLKDAGYNGEKVVLFHPTDQVFYNAMIGVVAGVPADWPERGGSLHRLGHSGRAPHQP